MNGVNQDERRRPQQLCIRIRWKYANSNPTDLNNVKLMLQGKIKTPATLIKW